MRHKKTNPIRTTSKFYDNDLALDYPEFELVFSCPLVSDNQLH